MAEKMEEIYAGRHSVFQVIKSEDGQTVTVRFTQNPEHKIDFMTSVVPTLIRVLQNILRD